MPESISIPATLADAKKALGALGKLITAKKWERAAIVSAFVRLSSSRGKQHPDVNPDGGIYTPEGFASFGIVGLSGDMAVTKYVQAWLDANNGKYPKPGTTRRLPTSPFPPTRTGTDGYNTKKGAADTVERIVRQHGPDIISKALTNLPTEHATKIIASSLTNLPDDDVEDIVALAHHDRPRPAQLGSTRDLRESLGKSKEPPKLVTMANEPNTSWMDAEREIGNIHHAITMLHMLHGKDPEMMSRRADDIDREAEYMRILAELCRGITTTDLDAALAAWTGE